MTFSSRHVTIVVSKGLLGDRSLTIHVGLRTFSRNPHTRYFAKGAGYIGGATLYAAWNCVRPWVNLYRPVRGLQLGATRNANRVPYTRH